MSDREGPSKSRRKRDAAALQALGEALAEFPARELAPLELPDRLLQALEELGHIRAHEARRRQCQFIGRLMREVDPAPLQAFIDERRRPSRMDARMFKLSEDWRDRMLDGGDAVLRDFLSAHPASDEREARQLADTLAAAREGRSGAARRLFRELRAVLEREQGGDRSPGAAALLE